MVDWFITLWNYRPDALTVWSDPVVKERLSHYYSVMKNEKPARFLVAKLLAVDVDPYNSEMSIEELWKIHEEAGKGISGILQRRGFRGPSWTREIRKTKV